ncbi:MAG TPA: caspase family protein [Candidatus Binatia bacterium]|nr:caspase family protein [Candidatus Binatia bacterium]
MSRATPRALAAAVLLLGGCLTAPEYKDTLSSLKAPAVKEGPLAGQSLRVILSENTNMAFSHMEQARGARMGMGADDLDPRRLLDGVTEELRTRFKSVALGAAAPGERRTDLTMILDARVVAGTISFTSNRVELAGIFRDDNQEILDTVTGKGESMVPYPNFASNFGKAALAARTEFARALDSATRLQAAVAARTAPRLVRQPGPPAAGGSTPADALVRLRAGASWAVVIGINRYDRAERLNYAVNDARSVAAALPRLGFNEVRVLLDGEATKAEFERLLYDELKTRMKPEDRLFVFFAGHGITVKLPRGGEEGYLLPVDGDPERPELTAIPMDEVKKLGRRVNARHVFFAIDACFSGFAIARAAGDTNPSDAELAAALEEPVVQVMTAGRKGQQAVEESGHGLFTRRLLEGLRGLADRDRRGFVTVTQLNAWLSPRVTRDSGGRQSPQYSALDGEGDFVFVLPPSP